MKKGKYIIGVFVIVVAFALNLNYANNGYGASIAPPTQHQMTTLSDNDCHATDEYGNVALCHYIENYSEVKLSCEGYDVECILELPAYGGIVRIVQHFYGFDLAALLEECRLFAYAHPGATYTTNYGIVMLPYYMSYKTCSPSYGSTCNSITNIAECPQISAS